MDPGNTRLGDSNSESEDHLLERHKNREKEKATKKNRTSGCEEETTTTRCEEEESTSRGKEEASKFGCEKEASNPGTQEGLVCSTRNSFSSRSKCIPARIVLAFLCATGTMELYMSRTNLSIAILPMAQIVNEESATSEEAPKQAFCMRRDQNASSVDDSFKNGTRPHFQFENETENRPPIKLTTTERGYILSAFFYAYGISGVIGGPLAEKYGTKKVFCAAVLIDALGNFLIPVASRLSSGFLIAIRFSMGFFQGMCYPSLHVLLSKWIPKDEFSRFISFVYAASTLGTLFTLNVCGLIISEYGWELVFYVCGSLSTGWLIFWLIFMHEKPESHPRISEEEKDFILRNRATSVSENKKIPWIKLLMSLPLWAVTAAHAGNMLGLGFMVTQLPIYLSSIIGVNIKTNGFLSSLPFLTRFIGANFFSWLTNFLIKRTNWSKKTWQRICTFVGHWCTALAILLVGYVGCTPTGSLCLFCFAMAFNGATASGYTINYLQLAPNFAGTQLGISTSLGFLYTTIGPVLVGALTSEETLSEWINVYWFIFGNYFVSGAFYMFFVSTDIQAWNGDVVEGPENDVEDELEQEKLKHEVEM